MFFCCIIYMGQIMKKFKKKLNFYHIITNHQLIRKRTKLLEQNHQAKLL